MDQEMTNYGSVNSSQDNNIIQQSNVRRRGWKFFFTRLLYMLALSIGIVYTMSRFSGAGILSSLQNTAFIFTLPILFIIGFALAMWRFWFSIIYFVIATPTVNHFLFRSATGGYTIIESRAYIFELLLFSMYEVPIFLIITLVVFGVEKGFSAIPQKWIRWTLALLPFTIMLITILLTYFK